MDELKPLEDRPVELRNVTDVKDDLDAFIHETQKSWLFENTSPWSGRII